MTITISFTKFFANYHKVRKYAIFEQFFLLWKQVLKLFCLKSRLKTNSFFQNVWKSISSLKISDLSMIFSTRDFLVIQYCTPHIFYIVSESASAPCGLTHHCLASSSHRLWRGMLISRIDMTRSFISL